jgi:hypothetical protein
MIELKGHILKLQKVENRMAELAGLKFRLMDEARLLGKDGKAYAAEYADALARDISEGIREAAILGLELGDSIHGR